MSTRQRMSRAVRTARGLAGALGATLLAAASHGLAGGRITPLALVATAVLALPLCVALAGRVGSLWRLSLAVAASQFLYHWSFSELGAGAAGTSGSATGGHAAHLGAVASGLAPGLAPEFAQNGFAQSGAADAWMWAAHAAAAILTIALLHRGERAAVQLAALIRRSLPAPPAMPRPAAPPARALPVFSAPDALRERLAVLSAISHRGPPAAFAADRR